MLHRKTRLFPACSLSNHSRTSSSSSAAMVFGPCTPIRNRKKAAQAINATDAPEAPALFPAADAPAPKVGSSSKLFTSQRSTSSTKVTPAHPAPVELPPTNRCPHHRNKVRRLRKECCVGNCHQPELLINTGMKMTMTETDGGPLLQSSQGGHLQLLYCHASSSVL